jgi:cytoskeletal protein CcmA (bactofilin family)
VKVGIVPEGRAAAGGDGRVPASSSGAHAARSEAWCRRWESNPHGALTPPDFESGASASFTTPATGGGIFSILPCTFDPSIAMGTIGPSLTITGEVTSDEDLAIEGRVRGYVTVRGATLTIGEQAHIDAELRGSRIVVAGRVEGGIVADQRIELQASAIVTGSLSATQVVIRDGARFQGGIDMAQRTIAAKVAQFRAAK